MKGGDRDEGEGFGKEKVRALQDNKEKG